MSNNGSASPLQPGCADRVAHALREARLTRHLSLEQIAASTRISLRYLAAIEAEDFSVFRADVYAIGFTKAFARAVGLSETNIADEVRECYAMQRMSHPG